MKYPEKLSKSLLAVIMLEDIVIWTIPCWRFFIGLCKLGAMNGDQIFYTLWETDV